MNNILMHQLSMKISRMVNFVNTEQGFYFVETSGFKKHYGKPLVVLHDADRFQTFWTGVRH